MVGSVPTFRPASDQFSHLRPFTTIPSRGVNFDFYRGFRFEAFWATMLGFLELVKHNWNQSVHTSDAILRMHVKMRRLAVAIKIWKSQHCGNLQLRLAIIVFREGTRIQTAYFARVGASSFLEK
jgi:hypothetical protein